MNRDLPGLIKGVSAEAADSENPALRASVSRTLRRRRVPMNQECLLMPGLRSPWVGCECQRGFAAI